MEISEYSINPYYTEHAGTHYNDDSRCKTFTYTAAGSNSTVHKSAESIGKAHNPRALKPRLDNRPVVGKQG